MVDLHSHILPGLDDGPATIEESVAMIRMAAADGVTDIVATPHANSAYAFDAETVDRRISALREASGKIVRIHRGCELHVSPANLLDALERPSRYAIGSKSYLLLEFQDIAIPSSTPAVLSQLRQAGLVPVLAHPERNPILQRQPQLVQEWVDQGCCVQLTAQSILGGFGKAPEQAALHLLDRALVHFIASDAHDALWRPPVLSPAWKWIAGRFGARMADRLLVDNPTAALSGAPLQDTTDQTCADQPCA